MTELTAKQTRSVDVFTKEAAATQQIRRTDLPEITITNIKKDGDTGYLVNYTYSQIYANGTVSGFRIKANDLVAFLITQGCEADKAFDMMVKITKTVITDYLIENHK